MTGQLAAAPPTYDARIAETWRIANAFPSDWPSLARELVRHATLAASSHNTQPWRFRIGAGRIDILPDPARRCPAVDPDDHHLVASLGCAAENLVHAAKAAGYDATVSFDDAARAVRVAFAPGDAARTPLFEAIATRQSTRAPFDGRPLSPAHLAALAAARLDGVETRLICERATIDAIRDMVIEGNLAQMRDRAFVAELKAWVRFDDRAALATGDGLSSRASGAPSVPGWLGRPMFGLVFNEAGETKKYRQHLDTAAGVAVFAADRDTPAGWAAAGRACQRFALQAAALGIRTAYINQPVEVKALRPTFAALAGLAGRRPDLVLRFGYGPALPQSLRRPVEDVIAAEATP